MAGLTGEVSWWEYKAYIINQTASRGGLDGSIGKIIIPFPCRRGVLKHSGIVHLTVIAGYLQHSRAKTTIALPHCIK